MIKEIAFGDGLPVTISGANSGTVVGHAMTPGVITAGAVSVAATPAFGVNPPVSESFSSSGTGSELLFANDGTRLASPQLLSPVVVSGLDDIATTVPGGLSDFYGTSAASASVAGVAAVILSANPNLTPAQVAQIMQQTALPMANPAVSGAGLVNVDAAVAAARALANVVIEAVGNTELVQQGAAYFLDPTAGGTGPSVKYQGVVVTPGSFNGWTPMGAEPLSGGGYEIAWFNTMSGQYWVWAANSSGNYSGDLFAAGAGNSVVLESLETSFHQDLNGDGVVGLPAGTSLIEGLGSTATVQVASNYYFDPVSGGTGPELKLDGAAFTVGTWGAWAPVGSEATANGFEIAFKIGADTYTVWNTDANGNITTNALPTSSGNSAALEALETSFHQDLNGDGTIGIPAAPPSTTIEAHGATALVQVGKHYALNPVAGGTGPDLKYDGTDFTAGTWGAWAPIGAEATASGYEVAWKIGADTCTVWNTDASGNITTNALGTTSGSSTGLEAIEVSFQQDLNGDHIIGVPSGIGSTTIEAFGGTALVQTGNHYLLNPVAGGTGPDLKYGGTDFTAGTWGAWAPIGAEATASGYEVAWKIGADTYTVWNTDASGNITTNALATISGGSTALEALETSFQQDLNGDHVIGIPSPASPAAQVASVASAAPAAFTGGDTFTFSPAIGGDPAGSTPPAVSPQAAEILTLATAAASVTHMDVADVHVLAFAHDVAIQGAVVDPLHGFMIH